MKCCCYQFVLFKTTTNFGFLVCQERHQFKWHFLHKLIYQSFQTVKWMQMIFFHYSINAEHFWEYQYLKILCRRSQNCHSLSMLTKTKLPLKSYQLQSMCFCPHFWSIKSHHTHKTGILAPTVAFHELVLWRFCDIINDVISLLF